MTTRTLPRRVGTISGERLVRRIDVLVDQLAKQGQQVLMRELRREIGRAPITTVLRQLNSGKPLTPEMIARFEGIAIPEQRMAEMFVNAYQRGGRATSVVYNNITQFAPNHPRALEWARTNAATKVQEINRETRAGVQNIISNALRTGASPKDTANQLRSSIGLTFRQTQMVADYRQRMVERGETAARANAKASDYGRSLLTQRVNAIADTEMAASVEAGKVEYLNQARDAGLWDGVLVWVTENDDRVDEVCELMAGQHSIGGYFMTPIGPQQYPPLHPYCRCQVVPEEGLGRQRGGRFASTAPLRRESLMADLASPCYVGSSLLSKLAYTIMKAIVGPQICEDRRQDIISQHEKTGEAKSGLDFLGVTPETFNRSWQETIDGGDLTVNVTPGVLDEVIRTGRFKSQFEAGTSHGTYDPSARRLLERQLFGLDEDLDPVDRPIYGSVTNAFSEYNYSDHYGSVRVVLKDSVRDRTTVTFGDSLHMGTERVVASPARSVDAVHGVQWNQYMYSQAGYDPDVGAVRVWRSSMDTDQITTLIYQEWDDVNREMGYVEAQIHGGLKVDDIDEVILTKLPPAQATLEELTRLGIRWAYKEDLIMEPSDIDDDFGED